METPYNIIAKILANEATADEKKAVEAWKTESEENKMEYDILKNSWQETNPPKYEPNVEAALGKVNARLSPQKKKNKNMRWLQIAAVLVLGIGLTFLLQNRGEEDMVLLSYTNTNDTPKDLTLNDGTIITLRKDATVEYPEKFFNNKRAIKFSGEAYFSVAKDKNRPFVIQSGEAITTVLGTEFNLRAIEEESVVKVTVTEGLVEFGTDEGKTDKNVMLEAGKVGELKKAQKEVLSYANEDENFMAWKTRVLKFDGEAFEIVLAKIGDFFNKDMTITFEQASIKTEPVITEYDSLTTFEEAIENIEILMGVQIEVKDNMYVVK